MVTYATRDVDGLSVFYREAGDPRLPGLVLLHGFPSSSHMFRTLMPALEDRFHLIAPDYPGFGNSEMPDPATFSYTFDHLADITEHLLVELGVTRFGLYMQDYGGPIGHRIIGRHPDWLEWLIVQNANTYDEGFTAVWDGLRHGLWMNRTPETEAPLKGLLAAEGVKQLYLLGYRDPARISPDAWNMDLHFLSRPHSYQVQLDLFYDYRTNVTLYPQWQAVLRARQPAALVIWGKGDIIFTPEGGLAYLRDLPDAEVHLLDSGHFVLEDQVGVVTDLIGRFYEQRVAHRLTEPATVLA